MARKSLFFLGVLLFITSLGIAFSQTRLAKANLVKSSKASLDVSPTDFVVGTKVPDTPIIESSQVVTSDSSDSPADFFRLLKSKTLVAVRSNWVYFEENRKSDVDVPDFGTFSNEQVIPAESVMEQWMFVNEAGIVEQSISIQRTMDGKVVQAGVFSEGTAWNTASDEIIPREPLPFELDYGLRFNLNNPDLKLSHSIEPDGKQQVQFTLTKVEDPPSSTREFVHAVQASENRYTFDEETGFLVRFESIAHLQDGSQRAFATIQVVIKPGINPPPDVLEYLKKKQDREGVK